MLIKCDNCGIDLSMPVDRCQNCGHWLPLTLNPDSTNDIKDSTEAYPNWNNIVGSKEESSFDSARVEKLLVSIASQSHFEERYLLKGRIASGGMGQVIRAFDQILKREVAIKMMITGRAESVAVRGQFLKEARVGGRLLHPNILPVFDLGVNKDGRIYYTMRLVDGASLQECMDSVDKGVVTKLISFPLRRTIEAFLGACHGVDYAHQNGVIHLDLKPHNIMVSGFNEVFVIDWGLARIDDMDDTDKLVDLYRETANVSETWSKTGVYGAKVVGTPGYMAPEQARGDVGWFDATTDVYGLGGILYFILYGTAPNRSADSTDFVAASTTKKTIGRLRQGIMPRGKRIKKEFQSELDQLQSICLKALEVERNHRYPSVEDMIVDLNEWLVSVQNHQQE